MPSREAFAVFRAFIGAAILSLDPDAAHEKEDPKHHSRLPGNSHAPSHPRVSAQPKPIADAKLT